MQCTKTRYETKEEANQTIKEIIKTEWKIVKKLPTRSYYCKHCKGHHLTSQPFVITY